MENNDKKEILEAISDFAQNTQNQFNGIDKRFDSIDKRFDAVSNQFDAVNSQFDEARAERQDLKQSFNQIQTSVDAYAKKAQTTFEELVSLNNAVKRHERWIEQIAKKLEIKLEY